MAFEFTDDNFKDTALADGTISVVDFWAEWCGPCRMVTPIIDSLSKEYDGRVKIGKLNVDQHPQVSANYGVRSIPTILILKDGEIADKIVGVTSQANLAKKIDAVLATAEPKKEATHTAVVDTPTGPFEFTDSNFADSAEGAGKISVVDFWAEWCGPCKALTPIITELAAEYGGKAVVGKLNVDDNPQVAMKYGVRSIPTVIILKDGKLVDKQVGLATKATLASKIEAALA